MPVSASQTSHSGIELETIDQHLVLTVTTQHLDFRNGETLKAAIQAALSEKATGPQILDLGHVDFMDSTGLGVMLFCKRQCDAQKRGLRLCSLQPYVQNLVTLTHLNKSIPVFKSREDALAAVV